jgi:hypothetical protein
VTRITLITLFTPQHIFQYLGFISINQRQIFWYVFPLLLRVIYNNLAVYNPLLLFLEAAHVISASQHLLIFRTTFIPESLALTELEMTNTYYTLGIVDLS